MKRIVIDNPIELLRKHYKGSILNLSSEPNLKFEKLRGMYAKEPKDFNKVIAEGLNSAYWTVEEVFESDLEGSKIEFYISMSVIVVTVPSKAASQLMKKLGDEGFVGLALSKKNFKKNSLFRGIYVILLTENEDLETLKKHEELHIFYRELSRSRNDAYFLMRGTKGEKHCEMRSIITELTLLSEILAYGVTEWDKNEDYHKKRFSRFPPHPDLGYCPISLTSKNVTIALLKQLYIEREARDNAGVFDKKGVLPDCGIVSKHMAINILEKAMVDYFEDVVDAGVESFRLLHNIFSEEEIVRIITSCGPTKEEIESGEYMRPIDEFILWPKYGKMVIKR